MKNDFIKMHLVRKIKQQVDIISKLENYKGFIWLDKPIQDGRNTINRIGKFYDCNDAYPFLVEEILPYNWYTLSSKAVYNIYKSLLNNEVYIIKKLSNDYSFKRKPNVTLELK